MTVNTDRLSPELTAYIKTLQAENDALQSKNEESQKELLLLKAQNSKLEKQVSSLTEIIVNNRKKMFGKSSEQMKYVDGAEQLTLFNEAEKESDAAAEEPAKETLVAAHKRKAKRTKKELTEDLRHVKEVIKLEEPVCEICGGELIPIGEEFVRSELNIIPVQIFVIDYYRQVYKCENCADDEYTSITKAEVSPSVMKKSMASAGTVAYVMQQKYQLGVPLYRQEQYWKAEGVDLRRNTLANWIIRSSRWFIPLWDRMKAIMLTENILHADETPLRVLKRNGQQTDSTSRMWVFCTGKDSAMKMSLYFYHPTRSGAVVKQVVGNYSGYLQTDGCASYNKAENAVQIGCWAHTRRKWTDCASSGIKLEGSNTAQALELISQIFAADKGLEGLPDEEKLKAKQEKVKPLIDKYWHLLENMNPEGNSGLKKLLSIPLISETILTTISLIHA